MQPASSAEVAALKDELSSSKKQIEHLREILREAEATVENLTEQAKVFLLCCSMSFADLF